MAWQPLRAGELRCELEIQAEVRSPNGQGGFTTLWSKTGDTRAKKIPLRGNEVLETGIVRSISTARFLIRPRKGLTTKHRLIEKASGTIWNVRRIEDPYGRRDQLHLDCDSGVAT